MLRLVVVPFLLLLRDLLVSLVGLFLSESGCSFEVFLRKQRHENSPCFFFGGFKEGLDEVIEAESISLRLRFNMFQ